MIELITCNNVSKSYKNKEVLKSISFSGSAQEVVCILGKNGAGKSTFLKLISGFVKPNFGSISYRNESIKSSKRDYYKNLSTFIDGKRGLDFRLTLIENAKYRCRLKGKSLDYSFFNKVADLLDFTQKKIEIRKLSSGNKIKASIICALSTKPHVLILDEPTNALDQQSKSKLSHLINLYASDFKSLVLVASHDYNFVNKIASRILVFESESLAIDTEYKNLERHKGYSLQYTSFEKKDYKKAYNNFNELVLFLQANINTIENIRINKSSIDPRIMEYFHQ